MFLSWFLAGFGVQRSAGLPHPMRVGEFGIYGGEPSWLVPTVQGHADGHDPTNEYRLRLVTDSADLVAQAPTLSRPSPAW